MHYFFFPLARLSHGNVQSPPFPVPRMKKISHRQPTTTGIDSFKHIVM